MMEKLFDAVMAINEHPMIKRDQCLPMILSKTARTRLLQALYLESVTGLSSTQELIALMADLLGQHPDSPNIRNAFIEDLPRTALVVADTVAYIRGAGIAFQTLSIFGRMLVQALEWPWHESELDRINRLHQGLRMRRHAAGMLALAHQARLRQWNVIVLPEMGQRGIEPDLAIQMVGSQPIYIEFESRFRGKAYKWQNIFRSQGFVAIIGFTPGSVYAYHRECMALRIPVISGSLQQMVMGDHPTAGMFQYESGKLPKYAASLLENQ